MPPLNVRRARLYSIIHDVSSTCPHLAGEKKDKERNLGEIKRTMVEMKLGEQPRPSKYKEGESATRGVRRTMVHFEEAEVLAIGGRIGHYNYSDDWLSSLYVLALVSTQ